MWAANPSVSTGPLLFIFCLPVPYEDLSLLILMQKNKSTFIV